MSEGHYDVAIIGAGMVGASLASLLSSSGFSVALVEMREPRPFDDTRDVGLRVSAVSPGSAAILAQAGAWKLISAGRHRPYRRMQVEDGPHGEALLFDAPSFNLERLGTIVENSLVQWSLWQVVGSALLVDLFCPDGVADITDAPDCKRLKLDSGKQLTASLVVAADGAGSRVRARAGIRQGHWVYNQHGLVAVVGKQKPNPGVAWQRFMQGGPLAFLPLGDGRSSIVWTRPTLEAERLMDLSSEAFMAELDAASEGWLGHVECCGPRAVFPLSMRLSESYVADRLCLVGDAAHAIHPLAGQGVNLGFADAAALAECLIRARQNRIDTGSPATLQAYSRWRRSEAELISRGGHAIRSLFDAEALAPVRRVGLAVVKRSRPLQEMFLKRAAGLGNNAPALARGTELKALLTK